MIALLGIGLAALGFAVSALGAKVARLEKALNERGVI